MRASFGSNHSTGLHIGGRLAEGFESEQVGGGSGGLPVAAVRAPLVAHPPLLGKYKERISEIRYPTRSEYLRAAVRCSDVVGPSWVEPSYVEIFSTCYRPSVGIHVWRPDFLTSYVAHVPKMVCFFDAAFENGLRFPLHPFFKCVLQHFNVCPTQLSPNFWGVLVGLFVAFRDKGLGVPSLALLLDLFSVKESTEGFLYISKRSNARLIISDMPFSHKYWKEPYFFVSGRNWEYNPADREDTLGVPTSWTTHENLHEFSLAPIGSNFWKSLGVFNSGLVMWFSGVQPGLNPEDEEVKRRLVKCHLRAYFELIRSDILGPSSAKLARVPILRPSPLFVMKPSLPPVSKSSSSSSLEPLMAKTTQGELRVHVEVLAKKRRSVKRKTQASPEGCPPAWGKTLKVGVSSSPLFTVGAGDYSGPLEVLPISVWSPTSQGAKPPPPPPQCQMMWEGVALVLWGMRTLCFFMWSSPLGLFPPSFAIPTSRRWTPCSLRRLWLFRFKEPLLYV